jgi:hypothetical protein
MLNLSTSQSHRTCAVLFFLLLPIILTSCTVIVWQNPVTPVDESTKDVLLPGAWAAGKKEVAYIGKPVDGWMSFAYVNRSVKEEKLFGKMYVSKLEGRSFLNVKFHDRDGNRDFEDGYLVVEYRTNGKRLWVSPVDADLVKQAVDRNLVPGAISERDSSILVIRAESTQVREFIRNTPAELLFPFNQKEFLSRIR